MMAGRSGEWPQEAEIVRRCLAGDEEAWAALAERFTPPLYALAVRGFRLSPEEAEEVVQDTFAHVFDHLADYRGTGPLGAWITAIGRNVARQRIRSRTRHPATALPEDAPDAGQQQALDAVEQALLVADALARLEPPCDDVLRRFFVLEQKYGEIAAALQIPPGTVASRIARCLVRLRRMIEDPAGSREETSRLRHQSK